MPKLDHFSPEELESLYRYIYDRWPMHSSTRGTIAAGTDYPWDEITEEHRDTIRRVIRSGLESGDTLHLKSYDEWLTSH